MFGQPEAGLGITPGFGGTQRLARIIGPGMAKQMIFTARNIKAEEAYRIGLVNAVYPQTELLSEAKKMAKGIADNAPIAVRNCKKAINDGLQVDMIRQLLLKNGYLETALRLWIKRKEWEHFLKNGKRERFL